ncbi:MULTISPECIES: Spy0128 family protein [unclassified Ruminococcus]|uniref:Spy0128 family protein n=1 Tax=unclassified Ruminococcus TaxID=2608920 RepID=UPI00189EA92A|nr:MULTISPECIES: FctA domain-containing protein [unclassified Ruminococcus]MDB8783560.1 SpaA isopeptide-forming pilin-related protein [Ruminococcus sp. 1001136sp1]
MKKNSRLKSFFAILLAVSMIFQQSSLTVLATDDIYVEDATATPTPSESEAEAYATEEGAEPVAEKQEEPQQVQETPAAEQAQEPTEVPAEQPTEAPAEQPTEAPVEQPTEAPAAAPTEAPATEPTAAPAAEVTEAPAAPEATATPAAEATATPTPEVSASPSETPTPAPTETPKTSFRYEDSRVVITATAPEDANLPQDAEIKADYIAPGTDRYNAAVAAFNSQLSSQLGLDAENTEAEYVLYDVYFLTADGSRIEPESGNVKVDMSFKEIQKSTVDGDVVNKDVVHLDNEGQAEVVTEYVNTNADGEITSMGFTQDSFSIVGGVTTVQNVAVQTGSSKLSDFITGMTIKVDGKEISSNDKISPSARYDFTISFAETSELVNQGKHIQKNMTFSMPNNLTNWPESGKLYADDNKTVVGDYTINDAGDVSVVFTDEFMQQADKGLVKGNFTFSAEIKNTVTDEVVKITVPGTTIEKEIHVNRDVNLYTEKSASYDEKTGEITYTIITKAENGNATDVKIIDKLGSDLELVKDSQGNEYTLTVDGGTPTPGKFAVTGNGYEVTVGELLKDKTATLVYKARFKDGVLEKIRNGESYSTNNGVVVKGKNGSKDIISNEPSVDIGNNFKNNQWFKKDNAKLVTEGGKTYLEWSFVYNVDGKQPVKGNTVTDTLQDNEYTKFKKGDVIHVKRSDGVEFDITVPADGNTWSYTIGKNSGDNYTDDSLIYKYTFSYKTLVDEAKLDSLIGSVSVKNDVDDGNRNHPGASGSGPLTGKVPNPEKTFLSGTQDKMKWRVTIHVPAGGMKFFIKDTVRQGSDNEDADGWNKWGWIDTSSITVTDPGKKISKDNVKYGQNVEGGKLCNYLFFLSKDSSGSDVETNKTYSEIEGIGEARDIILEYETFNKYQNATGDVAYKPGVLVRNTASGNGWEVFADGYVPGKLQVAKENVSSYFTGYGADDKKWSTEGNKICYCITIDKKRIGLGTEDVIITDTHSSSLSYVLGSAKLMWAQNEYKGDSNASGSDEAAGWMADPTIEENGKTVLKLNLGKLTRTYEGKNCVYKLYYQMAVDESLVTSSDGQVLSNSVSVKANGEDAAGEASCDYTYKKPLFTKEENSNPSVSNGYQAGFKITVKYTDNYKNSDGHLEIDDNCTNLKIDYSTFSVKQGERLLTANADYIVAPTSIGMKILILNPVEDATYVIEYKATVTGSIGSKIDYGNTAYINGRDEYYSKVSNNVEKKQNSSGNVEVSSLKLLLYKYDEENASKGLPNAIFELQDSNGKVLKSGIKTKANGETDEIQLSKQLDKTVFDLYVKYKLVETTAPSGYKTGNPIEFYFTDYSKSADELVKMGLQDAIAVFSNSTVVGTIEINNKKAEDVEGSAELEIQKAATGNWSGEIPNYFKFKLEALTPGAPELSNKEAANTGSKVTFEKITGYKEAKDYIYKISETGIIGEHPEWTVSGDVLYAKVSVRKEGNEYKTKVSYYSDENCTTAVETPVITNTYTAPTEGSAELEIQKAATESWTGAIPNYFQFKLEALTEGAPMPGTTAVTNNGSDISFGKITGYKEVKDYIYKISEKGIIGEHPEWSLSTEALYAKVSVSKERNEYKTAVSYYSDENCTTAVETPVITNTYTAPTEGSAELEIQKAATENWTGKIPNYFQFKLEALTEGAPMPGTTAVTNNGSDVSFGKITGYKEVKDYIYKISETGIIGEHPEWTVSSDVLYAKVSVRKEGNEYKTKVSYYSDENCTTAVETPVIINNYTTSGQIVLSANKTLEGQPLEAEQFSFQVTEIGEDGNAVENGYKKIAKNAEDGSIVFPTIKYEKTGIYYYQITEINGKKPAYKYDGSKYVVAVNVTDNMAGKLTAAIISVTKDGKLVENKTVTFNNTYSASADLELKAQKSMKVESEQLGTFEFELSGDNIETQTVTNNEAGAITFAPIHYNLSDVGNTYTYTVREKAPSTEAQYETDGIKYVYDTTVYTVKVKVEDNGDGTLKLTKTVKIGEKDYTDPEMKFVNDTTKATITKVDALGNQLSGVELEVRDKNNEVVDSWTTDGTPHVITGALILGETYKLVEKSAPAGYTLADPVEFTVSENDTDNKVEMKNTYSASGSLNLTAKKTLTTTETPLAKDQFTFELRDKEGKVLQTKTNDADGNVIFDEIKYSLVKDAAYKDNTDKKVDDIGEYQYTVNEVKGDAAGYTYDDTIYIINVTVTDAGNGTLTVTPVIHSSKATSEDATVTGMEFTNTYTTSGQIALGATKTLEGQTLEAEQFSFQATEMDADGKAVENGYSETVKNADGGAITFPIITYKESGTHYYQITEVKDEKPAYQYDESKYVVKVDVTDDNAGKLTAKVTSVTKNGEPVKSEDLTGAVTFTNTYSASADLELKAQKSMKVEAEQLGTFEFELKDADGKVIETVKNDEKGAISFSKLSYTEKDAGKTFTYTVNEKLPSEADTYVYDKTVYTVTVNVEDNRDGTLKLTTKVNGEDYTETAMKFVNDTTKVTISKVDDTTLKALAGAKLQVVDDQDKVVEEWTSDGTPHVITAKLVLGKTYKLVEAEAPSGYEIAEPITFTVDADDTKNAVEMKDAMTKSKTAAIEITKELKLNDALAGAKDMTFYAVLFADAECTIPASDVKALEFKNASSSTVTFTNLDLGRTYYVSETDVTGKAIDSGMTPDEKVYVPVYPQGQAITVTEDGAKSSITFENQFSEWPDGFYKIATLNVTKKLLGADGNALESDEIFYAGIFDDKECTTLSTRTEKNILTLDLAGGSTVSESTQAVVIPDESFTLYVAETDAEGNLVGGTDGFRYAVTVENGNVLFNENNLNAEVTIINQEQPEATPTVTPEETITPTPTPGTSTGVKTGDDTPIGFYMALLFVAALAIEETTRRRRKKEQD